MLFSTFGFYRFYCACACILFVRHYIMLLSSHLNLNGCKTFNKTVIFYYYMCKCALGKMSTCYK